MDAQKPKRINTAIIKAKDYWHMLGPGLTTGAADDDPSGIATYTQAGASFGFNYLWTALFTFPLMSVVQEMCARIGVVTGIGLAGSIRKHYSKSAILFIALLLFISNTINIGADLSIMGQVGNLLWPAVSGFVFIVAFMLISLILQIFTSYKDYAQYLKWLALILISYVITAFRVPVDWPSAIHHTFVPTMHWDRTSLFLFAAIIGTTISPYLFFWQTSQEVEQQILEGKTSIKSRAAITSVSDIKKMRVDVWSGMFISNIVMYFILVAAGATLFVSGNENILTTVQAAQALRPLAGDSVYLMFALGIIGTGMLAIPVLAGSTSYVWAESFGWKEGLYRKFRQAHAFYGVIFVSLILGLIFNLFHVDPIKSLLYSAVINGVIAPIILIYILLLSSSKQIMGEWVNKRPAKIVGWIAVVLMFGVSIVGIIGLVSGI